MQAKPHPDQQRRLEALHRYQILDTPEEAEFDEVVDLLARLCDAPISVINLIDADRQWFKAEVGLGMRSTPLDTSLCAHVILDDDFVEIPDTLEDKRMADNPLCLSDPGLRFYAGSTLRTAEGLPIGTLCVLDYVPRNLNPLQRRALEVMAAQVMRQLELRLALRRQDILRREIDHRVKNSLASVSAIIQLQASRSGNAQVKEALGEVQARLTALLSMHAELQWAGDEAVDLQRLIGRLTKMLGKLVPPPVVLRYEIEPVVLAAGQAQAVGIIVNEFVANAGKHAFPDNGAGQIVVRGRRAGDRYELICSDDGTGGDEALAAVLSSSGLGVSIIAASARSLRAQVDWSAADRGLTLRLSIPLDPEP